MPLYIKWSATDKNNRFILTSVDLSAQVLKLVAGGKSLRPGSAKCNFEHHLNTSGDHYRAQLAPLTQ
jgi:hypothetical protein